MVKRRININENARRVKSVNQGASCFTDFFDERNEFNESPDGDVQRDMSEVEIDFFKGTTRRKKNG